MFRNIFMILLFSTLLSCASELNVYTYENSELRVVLKSDCDKITFIEMINKRNNSTYRAIPQLVMYDDEVPVEGGLVSDYNIMADYASLDIKNLYSCDSVYDIKTDSICLDFGQERITHRRLDLYIYNSRLHDFIDGNYTLYVINKVCN